MSRIITTVEELEQLNHGTVIKTLEDNPNNVSFHELTNPGRDPVYLLLSPDERDNPIWTGFGSEREELSADIYLPVQVVHEPFPPTQPEEDSEPASASTKEDLPPLPVVAYKGPDDTDASMFLNAEWRLRGGYPLGGSNLTAAVIKLMEQSGRVESDQFFRDIHKQLKRSKPLSGWQQDQLALFIRHQVALRGENS